MLRTTRCDPSWPRTWVTYHQETSPPFRRAERVRVLRLGRRGLVVGRWTSVARDEDDALLLAMGGREVDVLDEHRLLLPHFRRRP